MHLHTHKSFQPVTFMFVILMKSTLLYFKAAQENKAAPNASSDISKSCPETHEAATIPDLQEGATKTDSQKGGIWVRHYNDD